MSLANQFAAYTAWRSRLSTNIGEFQDWLSQNELSDAQTDLRLAQLLERLREDRLNVAFVAEFSRGKSELINAIFFAEYGSRMLPSSAGRTTMCPTELLFDGSKQPCIELLPIQTRASNSSVSEYKRFPDEWTVVGLDIESPDAMQDSLRHVSETSRVTPEEAARLGFEVGQGEIELYRVGDDGLVEVPRWRHAVINFPHPLLKQGLVILDTPGLNAIGAEPELTLSLLPNAHAVLFILAADTGVTQSDLAIWKEHICGGGTARRGRMVVMNKIDGQWDELKTDEEIDAEIQRQVDTSASILDLPASQIFPVSAQKGLVAKINGDDALLEKSRLPLLELALSEELIPAKRDIVCDNTDSEFGEVSRRVRGLLESRLVGLREQLTELTELRGKNKGVVEYMMGKVRAEKDEFESGLQRYYAVRSVFSTLTNRLFAHLGLDVLRQLTQDTREAMLEAAFSKTLSDSMGNFFGRSREALVRSNDEINEILAMMAAVYKRFAVEHGLKLGAPTSFSLLRYEKEIDRLEAWCDGHLNTMVSLLTHDKRNITQKFFEEVAVQVRRAFEHANKDAETWLGAIMAPMETQVREHQIQLKRRLESIKRIHQATDTLEDRIVELESVEKNLLLQIQSLEDIAGRIREMLLPLDIQELQAA
ncbi:dynamin family protein [Dechloromonas denitrificans]|uniref:dynamin family protein n=1 Tax=Dechloromonas denitrificans TaxID=281362 RepID=UPI001CF8F265|nr:dynamin family protein [Dechloromonas denitrificans]UCV04216.1 dynamin family protein [Dechloromonas denitrificans]